MEMSNQLYGVNTLPQEISPSSYWIVANSAGSYRPTSASPYVFMSRYLTKHRNVGPFFKEKIRSNICFVLCDIFSVIYYVNDAQSQAKNVAEKYV
jgi:hypothetical protein